MGEILYLSAQDTRELVGYDDVLDVVEQVYRWQAAGQVRLASPPNFDLSVPEARSLFRAKQCSLGAVPVVGLRYTGYHATERDGGSSAPDNARFVLLSDPATARPLAIVEEHYTFNLRTSAAGVFALRRLANPTSRVAGIVGAGEVARTCLELLARSFQLSEVRVASRTAASREKLAADLDGTGGASVIAVASPREAVEGADVVVSATSSREPVVLDGWLAEGATLCGLGVGDVDPRLYHTVDRTIVSDWDVVSNSEDVRKLLESGSLDRSAIWADLAEIVSGARPGRQSPRERIFVRASGLVSQDVAVAYHAYRQALERGLGTRLVVGAP